MKKKLYLTSKLLLFAAVLFAINSCSKSKSSGVTPTMANLVGTYKLSSETSQQGTATQINILESLPACEKDDELRFNADSSYDYLDDGTVCTPTGAYSGTWDLPSSNILVLDDYSLYSIKSFDNITLVMIFTDLGSSPIINYTLTLVKQ